MNHQNLLKNIDYLNFKNSVSIATEGNKANLNFDGFEGFFKLNYDLALISHGYINILVLVKLKNA